MLFDMIPGEPEWKWFTGGVELYSQMIRTRVHFAQANYGDGEFGCLLGKKGRNVNGEVYEPELAEALRRTLLEPAGHWCGYNPGRKLEEEAYRWLMLNDIEVPWVWKETLSAANVNGQMGPFFLAANTRRIVVVGPEHLARIPYELFKSFLHIRVPDATAWKETDRIAEEVFQRAERDDLILFAAGMATNLLIWRLWPNVEGNVTLLDVGAILDPYAGKMTRKGYRLELFQKTNRARNLNG
jgi:hypothetical protein